MELAFANANQAKLSMKVLENAKMCVCLQVIKTRMVYVNTKKFVIRIKFLLRGFVTISAYPVTLEINSKFVKKISLSAKQDIFGILSLKNVNKTPFLLNHARINQTCI